VYASDALPDDSAAGPKPLLDAAADWYRTVSYGRLEFQAQTLHRWLHLPLRSAEYAADHARYLADAVAAADPDVDFSQVDVVYLVPAGRTPVATPVSAILNSFGVYADGKEIRAWVPFDPGFADATAPSVLLQETGHLLGLPDLFYVVDQAQFKRAPVQIVATDSDSRPPTTNCGPRWNAPFDIGRGEARGLQLSTWGFRLRLLAKLADGSYRVRVGTQ
jgi:hypothetical protein